MAAPRVRIGLYIFATVLCLVALGFRATAVRASGLGANLDLSRRVAAFASALEQREVVLRAEGESRATQWLAIGYHVNREATLNALLSAEPTSTWWERLFDRLSEQPVPPPELEIVWQFDPSVAHAELHKWAEVVKVPARDAVVNYARHARDAEQPGRELNLTASVAAAAALHPPFDDQLELVFDAIAPRITLAELPAVDPRKVLARFDTDFHKKRGPRVHNIRTAAAYLDGSLIGPGETLSFNRVVGARSAARGFIDAPVIVNDVMESGMGGGVCQVATALHAVAIFGGLEILERRSHSRPSGYAPLGLDATVIDGIQDLRIRNPYETAVYVHAYSPSRYVLRIELLGAELLGTIEHKFWVAQRHNYTRRIVTKPELATGMHKQAQKGGYGYDTVSTVTHVEPNGQRTQYRYKSKYYPVPEVLWVGPGTNRASLPPLPKGAMSPTEVISTDGE